MIPTKKSIRESKDSIEIINKLLNNLKDNPNEDSVFQIIQTAFNSKGIKLSDEYIDLLCNLFGDKLVECNNTSKPIIRISKKYIDGFDICFFNKKDNDRILEISNFGNRPQINYIQYIPGNWNHNWIEVSFSSEKWKPNKLRITDYNYKMIENNTTYIKMDKQIKDITNDVVSIVGKDLLPEGPIRKTYMNSHTRAKIKEEI